MDRHEAIKAMLEGKKVRPTGLIFKTDYCYYDTTRFSIPFMFCNNGELHEPMDSVWEIEDWQILEEPKTRPMTRNEVLGFLAHNNGVVVRLYGDWQLPERFSFGEVLDRYEYAHISEDGVIGEAKKFEIEEK